MTIDINKLKKGDVFSEESHYVVDKVRHSDVLFTHLESGTTVTLSHAYIRNLLDSADQYKKVVKVGREDKADGTPGIRSIWENINTSEVFTVVFQKQDKAKSKKAIAEERALQVSKGIEAIEKAKKAKKSMVKAYEEALREIQNNPITEYVAGEDRVLRGYKVQMVSRDERYNCIDIDLRLSNDSESELRPVNINTIKELIIGGIKYVVQ